MKVVKHYETVRTIHRRVKYEIGYFQVLSYQCRGVLVRPKSLWDGPVANGNTGFGVWPYIDELVTTMPRLHTRLERLRSGIWTEKRRAALELKQQSCIKSPLCSTAGLWVNIKLCGQFEFRGSILKDKNQAAVFR